MENGTWLIVGVLATFVSIFLFGLLRKLVAQLSEDGSGGRMALIGLNALALILTGASTYYLVDRTARLERQVDELSLRAEIISAGRGSRVGR